MILQDAIENNDVKGALVIKDDTMFNLNHFEKGQG